MIQKSKRQKLVRRVYWPNCMVCQYMKKNKDFRYRIMTSTYFHPEGQESAAEVVHAFGDPFKLSTFYAHLQRHQAKDLIKAQQRFDIKHKTDKPDAKLIIGAVEGTVENTGEAHEQGLDEFIRDGRALLASGELKVTATTFLQAIKIKSDNEKSTKDRRLEAMKAIFKSAAPKNDA